jgi:RluA family pseudouridine synthase
MTQLRVLAPDAMPDAAGRVLLQDANLLILDKPAGLPVHPGPSAKRSLEDWLPALRFGLRHLPVLAHRLDQDTSGCVLVARHPKARSRLGRLFEAGAIVKTYWAIVADGPAESAGRIDLPLGKSLGAHGWKIIVDPQGKPAATAWRVLGRGGGLAWLELTPETGRTHQIRVHLKALGCPILGDPVYGPPGATQPMHLHARRIAVPYWSGRPPVTAEAPPPPHMLTALAACRQAASDHL